MDLTLAICVYNASRYIEETLESVMAQTRQDYTLLIIDDSSTDDSVAIIRDYFKRNPRQYELIALKQNRGICHGRHLAERTATTRYMMFLDSDDVLYPEAIDKMYTTITSDPDLMAVGCYLEYIDENSKRIGGGLYLGEKTKEGFYRKAQGGKLIFMQPTAIYDRQLALSVGGYIIDGYPEGKPRYQDYCEDLDLWTRMSDLYIQGKAIIVVPEVLCGYRKIGNGLSSNSQNMILKMRYTKSNVRRRRSGEADQTFIAFYNSLSKKQIDGIRRESLAADSLRNGAFYLKNKKYAKAIQSIATSLWAKPGYIIDKIKKNLLH